MVSLFELTLWFSVGALLLILTFVAVLIVESHFDAVRAQQLAEHLETIQYMAIRLHRRRHLATESDSDREQ